MYDDFGLTNITTNSNNNYGALAALGAFALFLILIAIAVVVVVIIGEWKMYKKAGKKGWECIIPFYSNWVYADIAGLNWWWFFILSAGVLAVSYTGNGGFLKYVFGYVGTFGTFVANYNIAKKLHKGNGFAVLMTLLPFIMIPVIGFSSSYKFDDSVKVNKNGFCNK